ncbi:DUF6341 family protein [Gangjinia marincola]
MEDFFKGIESFFVDFLFSPFEALRATELESWFMANGLNWIFMIIGFVAFVYWMIQLKKFNDNNEENREVISHSFLHNKDFR